MDLVKQGFVVFYDGGRIAAGWRITFQLGVILTLSGAKGKDPAVAFDSADTPAEGWENANAAQYD